MSLLGEPILPSLTNHILSFVWAMTTVVLNHSILRIQRISSEQRRNRSERALPTSYRLQQLAAQTKDPAYRETFFSLNSSTDGHGQGSCWCGAGCEGSELCAPRLPETPDSEAYPDIRELPPPLARFSSSASIKESRRSERSTRSKVHEGDSFFDDDRAGRVVYVPSHDRSQSTPSRSYQTHVSSREDVLRSQPIPNVRFGTSRP